MRDDDGISPLGYAILYERTEIKDYLLEQGCTLDDDEEKIQLLCKACGEEQLGAVKTLIQIYNVNPKGDV